MLAIFKTRNFLLVVLVALVTAFISAKYFAQGNALVSLPWGALAFLCAFIASRKKEVLVLGGSFGFIVSYAYLWFDNTDSLTVSKVAFLIALIFLPALFGLLCGLLAAWVGWLVRKRLLHR